jgi:hypothetical protein
LLYGSSDIDGSATFDPFVQTLPAIRPEGIEHFKVESD